MISFVKKMISFRFFLKLDGKYYKECRILAGFTSLKIKTNSITIYMSIFLEIVTLHALPTIYVCIIQRTKT